MKYSIIILILLIMPSAYAWNWNTHQHIMEYVYLNLPPEKKLELNLTKLLDGAIIPDRDFKDHRNHHYPDSLEKAQNWLNNDTDLSLSIGIASHYITDSFVAPHNVMGESGAMHSKFENQVSNYYPKVECKDYNYTLEDLKIGTENAKDWDLWLKTKDKTIPEREVDQATKFLFSIVLKKLNVDCTGKTVVTETPYINTNKIILISLTIVIGLISLFIKKRSKFL